MSPYFSLTFLAQIDDEASSSDDSNDPEFQELQERSTIVEKYEKVTHLFSNRSNYANWLFSIVFLLILVLNYGHKDNLLPSFYVVKRDTYFSS